MIVYVDYEHADFYSSERGERIQAARTRITYRLEDLSGRHCMLVRYDRMHPELLERIGAEAIFISGNATDPRSYDPAAIEPLAEIVRTTELPIFGFCGGFQFLATALGAQVVPLEVDDDAPETDLLRRNPESGRWFEFGYHPVTLERDHPLLAGWDDAASFRHAHGLHVPTPPDGFRVYASTPATPVQLAVHEARRIVGTQFHPEYWTDEHPAGRTLIANFLVWSGLTGSAMMDR